MLESILAYRVEGKGYWIVSGPVSAVLSGERLWFTASAARGQAVPWDSSMVLRFLSAVDASMLAIAQPRMAGPTAQEEYLERYELLKALRDALNAQFLSC